MPDLLPFDARKDESLPSRDQLLGIPASRKAQRPDPSHLFDTAQRTSVPTNTAERTSVPTNAYLVTLEITETVERTYLVPAFSPEEAERLLARGRQNYEEVSSAPQGIEAAQVVNIEPVTSSHHIRREA